MREDSPVRCLLAQGARPSLLNLYRRNPMIKWIRILYLIVAWLFPTAILFQVLLVGLSLFTTQSYWDAHMTLGHWIALLPILLVGLSYLGQMPPPAKLLTWL